MYSFFCISANISPLTISTDMTIRYEYVLKKAKYNHPSNKSTDNTTLISLNYNSEISNAFSQICIIF